LGEYRLIEKLGQGQTATVYRAYQASLNRPVAVKVLHPDYTSKIGFVSRFKREARLVARLRHPHILPLYDYGEHKGLVYLVTDYVEGNTLQSRLHGELTEWHQAASLLLPIARALAYVHSQGVTHRDVKPSNILIGPNDWPLLADFGIAKIARADMPATMTGKAIDIPYYMSPEQAQTIQVDERADIYSLGVVLYELVTGRLPFTGDSPLEVMRQHLNEMPESPCAINPSLPAMGEAIIMRAMTKNPGGRYQLMGELVNALQVALTQTSMGSVDPTYTPMIARHETCPRCGAPVNMLGRYCTKCGAKLRPGSGFLSRPQPETPADTTPGKSRAGEFRFVLESGRVIYFPPKTELTIGRADKNSELFPDIDLAPHDGATLGVSRVHAQLRLYGDSWIVEDQGSTNGTFVNGRRVGRGEEVGLRIGDRLRCGRLVMTFQT
jgi:serine/threonine protein kinase